MLLFNIFLFAVFVKLSISYEKELDLAIGYTVIQIFISSIFGVPFLSLIVPAIITFFVMWGLFWLLRILSGFLWWLVLTLFIVATFLI